MVSNHNDKIKLLKQYEKGFIRVLKRWNQVA